MFCLVFQRYAKISVVPTQTAEVAKNGMTKGNKQLRLESTISPTSRTKTKDVIVVYFKFVLQGDYLSYTVTQCKHEWKIRLIWYFPRIMFTGVSTSL